MTFTPPARSIQFLLTHSVDLGSVLSAPGFEEVNAELIGDILTGAADFAENVWAPTNWDGDQHPAKLEGDNVIASPGFKEAYHAFVEAQWLSLATSAEIGGMGLPQLVKVATDEMFYAANMALGLCPMLTSSAAKAIEAHASDELKATYLPKMINGEWTGAMDLTEPQAGSDLGPVRTKAVENGDGTYSITGQKIFITWGDHDVADNVIHLVLARLPDAPAGSKGISLFLCPKVFVGEDGSLGERNSFRAIGLEHKLGIHGSPTCVMDFDKATGWMVGEENRGLACMFTMMNEARLFVGVQGVAIGERAYQAALGYAKERVQGRTFTGQEAIIGHPDIRRSLIDMKARLAGARAICMATAAAGDLGDHKREALLTPVAKSYGSDTGVEVSSIGVQIHGGMGYIEETGAAQHYRDSRIAPIYEGTNGIQALDLVGRKLRRDGGEAMAALIADIDSIQALAKSASAKVDIDVCLPALKLGVETLKAATQKVLSADEGDAIAGATPYLNLVADIISGAFLIRAVANGALAGDPLSENMAALARYHALAVMPKAQAQLDLLQGGTKAVFDFSMEQLADA